MRQRCWHDIVGTNLRHSTHFHLIIPCKLLTYREGHVNWMRYAKYISQYPLLSPHSTYEMFADDYYLESRVHVGIFIQEEAAHLLLHIHSVSVSAPIKF
jgi:hypothetical protein